jgi:hypothetical protein
MSRFNGFFDNFSSALGNPKGNLGDYAHASALYVRNNLRLAPKVKFLYHVTFDINQNASSTSVIFFQVVPLEKYSLLSLLNLAVIPE